MSAVDDDALAAYHEAGHVVVAHLVGGRVVEASIESEHDGHRGHTQVVWSNASTDEVRVGSALAALGGPIAETLWLGDEPDASALGAWRADWEEVEAALADAASDEDRDALRSSWIARVVSALRDPVAWERACRVADHLEAHGTLEEDQIEDLLGSA